MSDNVTDEEVQDSRQKVADLQQELDEVNRKIAENEASRNNAVRKERLDRQATTLEQQLEAARSRLQVSEDTPPEEALKGPEDPQFVQYPVEKDGGWYALSDGTNVQGKEAAVEAQRALDNPEDSE